MGDQGQQGLTLQMGCPKKLDQETLRGMEKEEHDDEFPVKELPPAQYTQQDEKHERSPGSIKLRGVDARLHVCDQPGGQACKKEVLPARHPVTAPAAVAPQPKEKECKRRRGGQGIRNGPWAALRQSGQKEDGKPGPDHASVNGQTLVPEIEQAPGIRKVTDKVRGNVVDVRGNVR